MSITQTRKFDHITPVLFDLNSQLYLSIFKKYMQWIYTVKWKNTYHEKLLRDYTNKKVSKNVQIIKGVLQLLLFTGFLLVIVLFVKFFC